MNLLTKHLFFVLLVSDAAGGGRSTQQNKKPLDAKKLQDDSDESSNNASVNSTSNSTPNTTGTSIAKDEDDVYEFKSTPKDSSSSSGDDKSDAGKGSDKSSDEKSDDQSVNQLKRVYSDAETNDDGNSADDETKRKKRKDSEQTVKDAGKGSATSRSTPQRQEKGVKSGPAKGACLNKSTTALEKNCPSPKPASNKTTTDSDAEADDKNGESFGSSGPKVPPLKIVIPQQGMSGDQETGSRNGKNASARNHAALPYVVLPSSSNSNDSADKESVSSRCTSPSDSAKSVDEKKMSNEEQRQQRVLRSSHRGGQSVDRGSNNSSPQQSSSPSPAPPASSDASTSEATAKQTTTAAQNNNPSPANPPATSDTDNNVNVPSPSSTSSAKESTQNTVDLHPRKRKIRASKEENKQSVSAPSSSTSSTDNADNVPSSEIHPHDQPITNCYQMYLNIRQQIERRHRNLFPVQPKAPQGFQDYLMNRRTYVLHAKTPNDVSTNVPATIAVPMKDLFTTQEKERHKLKMQHVVEKEKLVLAVEQEILRVHSRAARALANQSLPFSACTILRDEEVYNMITPEQEEKDRNARSRYNGRLFISWLQDVDDKWEKIKVRWLLFDHFFF